MRGSGYGGSEVISKKMLGYRLFGFMFTLFRLWPVSGNKTFLIATHDDSPEGNIALAAKAIKRHRPQMRFIYLRDKSEGLKDPFSFFFIKAFHMATSSVILLDDTFLPMAYTPISKKTRVIQLWHGTGAIKRFGPEVEKGELRDIAIRGNKRITTLAVNGKRTKGQYASAFCVEPEKVRITGLPRTDLMLDGAELDKKKKDFFDLCREEGKKRGASAPGWMTDPERYRYVLYAPTFRDDEVDDPHIAMDTERVMSGLPEDTVLMLRLHPHVAKAVGAVDESAGAGKGCAHGDTSDDGDEQIPGVTSGLRCIGDKVIDVSAFRGAATLLSVADVLVTDYSSIIFEYAVLKKPMIFYAYDLEDFRENGRDFYEPYESFVPGPVVRDEESLIREVQSALDKAVISDTSQTKESRVAEAYVKRAEAFLRDNYKYLDGRASERIASIALSPRRHQSGANENNS